MYLLDQIVPHIRNYLRSSIKWFLHIFTRLCELQRICYGARSGASRTLQIEHSLASSKNAKIKELLIALEESVAKSTKEEMQTDIFYAVAKIASAKRINPISHPDFSHLLLQCLNSIWNYKFLERSIEELRSEAYNSECLMHEEKLITLWALLMPEEHLQGRISKQWQYIGFQGDDPKTDFRGMGMLGLENLIFFANEYNSAAKHVLLHSMHPTHGYTFAIVGINLTSMAYRLIKSGAAKTHFYNLANRYKKCISVLDFHQFYCYLFFEFDRFWVENRPETIMEFPDIYQSFENVIQESLNKEDALFKTNLLVEHV